MTTEITTEIAPQTETATKNENDDKRTVTASTKELRALDAASAMREYEEEKRAVLARTEQLRALRLARDSQAANAGGQRTKKPSR
jgi:hypothetical protein